MNTEPPVGQRYSLVYLRQDTPLPDSTRWRIRLVAALKGQSYIADALGKAIETELGVRVWGRGYSGRYLDWDILERGGVKDLLDSVTLAYRLLKQRPGADTFLKEIRRIFAEEQMAYRLDDAAGVHPFIDPSHQLAYQSTVSGLNAAELASAAQHVLRADQQLLPQGDSREAIRAIFDAAENVFKVCFPGVTSLNGGNIQAHLKPAIEQEIADPVAKRTAHKLLASLIDWVDAAHNYRHEPGHADPVAPPADLAVLMVSQGLAHVRWLAGLKRKLSAGK